VLLTYPLAVQYRTQHCAADIKVVPPRLPQKHILKSPQPQLVASGPALRYQSPGDEILSRDKF